MGCSFVSSWFTPLAPAAAAGSGACSVAAISAPVANALLGLLPAPNDGFLPFKPTAGDVLVAVSLDFSLSGELEALFKGDGLR